MTAAWSPAELQKINAARELEIASRRASGTLRRWVCVPTTSSTSCGQPIFVDHATDLSLSSDAVQVEIDWLR